MGFSYNFKPQTFTLNNTANYTSYYIVFNSFYYGVVLTSISNLGNAVCFIPYSTTTTTGYAVVGTDYSISSNATTGAPVITKLTTCTSNYSINTNNLLVEEAYRRLYPVIRDTNTIILTDGFHTATLTSTSIPETGLLSATTTISVSSATAPSSGQVLTATSSLPQLGKLHHLALLHYLD